MEDDVAVVLFVASSIRVLSVLLLKKKVLSVLRPLHFIHAELKLRRSFNSSFPSVWLRPVCVCPLVSSHPCNWPVVLSVL
jgi:hypothetical protein